MRKMWSVACVISALAFVTPAMAADLPVKAPPAPPPVPYLGWTGCYIGGHAGGAFSRAHHTFDDGRVRFEDFNFDADSVIAGGHVGCQYQFYSNWVIGVEGTWSALGHDRTENSVINPSSIREFRHDQIVTAVGRLGWTFFDRWMLYGVGGFATARIRTREFEPLFGAAIFEEDRWRSGVTAGAGLEFRPWQNVVFGIEGDWYRFDFDHSGLDTTGFANNLTNSRLDVFAVTGRVSWLFNFGGWPAASPAVVSRY
jgi:outer membrane immunogenic protein